MGRLQQLQRMTARRAAAAAKMKRLPPTIRPRGRRRARVLKIIIDQIFNHTATKVITIVHLFRFPWICRADYGVKRVQFTDRA